MTQKQLSRDKAPGIRKLKSVLEYSPDTSKLLSWDCVCFA